MKKEKEIILTSKELGQIHGGIHFCNDRDACRMGSECMSATRKTTGRWVWVTSVQKWYYIEDS